MNDIHPNPHSKTLPAVHATEQSRSRWISTLLWSTCLSNVVLTVPLLWKAYQFSSHLPGTQQDADFWFLVQSCASQLIGLILSGMGLWRQAPTMVWSWLPPTIAAGISNVIAIPLYLVIATEWSSFAVVVAGSIQTFLVLQLAIVGD